MKNFERGQDPKRALQIGVLEKALELLEEAKEAIGMARFELGEEWDEDDMEGRIGEFLDQINK